MSTTGRPELFGPDTSSPGVWELAAQYRLGRRSVVRWSGRHLEAVRLVAVRREVTPVACARRATPPERIDR